MNIPAKPKNSFRIELILNQRAPRLDNVLLEAIRAQTRNGTLRAISRSTFKKLFDEKKILIKGQSAKTSSSLAVGTTYVDIIGYDEVAANESGE